MNHQQSYSSPSPRIVVSTLIAYDAYIVSLMKNAAYARLSFMDRDDITQQVRLKTLGVLQEKDIRNPYAYLKSMVHNEYVSYVRRQKPVLPLLMTDEGEIVNEFLVGRQGSGDPQIEFEEMSNFYTQLDIVVRLIVALPKVQKRVAVCVLRDRIDDLILLTEVFKQHNLDISTLQWPTDPREKQRLQASYAPVRQKLAQAMNVDLTLFKARNTCNVYQLNMREDIHSDLTSLTCI